VKQRLLKQHKMLLFSSHQRKKPSLSQWLNRKLYKRTGKLVVNSKQDKTSSNLVDQATQWQVLRKLKADSQRKQIKTQ